MKQIIVIIIAKKCGFKTVNPNLLSTILREMVLLYWANCYIRIQQYHIVYVNEGTCHCKSRFGLYYTVVIVNARGKGHYSLNEGTSNLITVPLNVYV